MREIKFKGKRKDNSEWVIGYFIPMKHNDMREHIHIFIIPEGVDMNYGVLLEDVLVEVLPETVGQYTGLKDKNGTEIYEGDVVKFDNDIDEVYEEVGVCVFEKAESNFVLQYKGYRKECYALHTIYLIDNEEYQCLYEVLGNKYENPELITD